MNLPHCPKCQLRPQRLPGLVAFPDEYDTHDREWLICWGCELRAERLRGEGDAVWVPFSEAPPENQEISWKKHTKYHWQTKLNGELLDYWPTTFKFRYRGVTHHGDINLFIENNRGPTHGTDEQGTT
jgi:hypothetical protein